MSKVERNKVITRHRENIILRSIKAQLTLGGYPELKSDFVI